MPEYRPAQEDEPITVFLNYTIRFDQKGYRVFDSNSLLNYFNRAKEVERIIFDIRSRDSVTSNGNIGSYANLRLDSNELATCFLTVDSDSEEWVNGTFNAVRDALQKCKNKHGIFRNPFADFILQFFGVLVGFALSLWGASIISTKLVIENAFLISFLLVLIVFSNLWTQIKQYLNIFLFRSFPKIKFRRPNKNLLQWSLQTIIGGIIVAITLYLLGALFTYMGSVLGVFIQ